MIPALGFLAAAALCFGLWFRVRPESKGEPDSAPETVAAVRTERETETPAVLPSLPEIKALESSGELNQAREQALLLLESLRNQTEISEVEKFLGDLHLRLVFSSAPMEEKVNHMVKMGDTLGELAKTYGTTKELIAEMNGISNNIIRVGKSLQILTGTFTGL
ncbi:MAG: LysM peptidoglycan-binding domain-containing protein, partial [Kiritimatiellia bacterium]